MVTKERFQVSDAGMREQHQGREPWELAKELVQNAWDEAPEATTCQVTITQENQDQTWIMVEDDGPGFREIEDAYTLLRPTPKRGDPRKRGRFNMGEKEVISVAVEAHVETVGWTVIFPRDGGRDIVPNQRGRGTSVSALMPWTRDQAEELEERLAMFRPTECRLVVNGKEVPQRETLSGTQALLETVIQSGPGEPVRRTRRKGEVHIVPQAREGESWLYEMGIPIQKIKTPWDVDVQQKVPLPPNRTEVPTRYLNALYAVLLNLSHKDLAAEEFGSEWVTDGPGGGTR